MSIEHQFKHIVNVSVSLASVPDVAGKTAADPAAMRPPDCAAAVTLEQTHSRRVSVPLPGRCWLSLAPVATRSL